MANRIKIEIVSQPANYSQLVFTMAITGYSKVISKTFIPGYDSTGSYVVKGVDAEATLNSLYAKLNVFDADGNVSFELAYPFIYCNFHVAGEYGLTVTNDAGDSFVVTDEEITLPLPETLPELVYSYLSIRIFDTYVNERILIEELASASACKLNFDGGDDLHKQMMVSACVFNMAVLNAQDAYFLHLFSGDEKRYRVEVVGVDEDDNEQLIWQGFLLPDQYNEPYQQVMFFCDFTATDMLGSLKGEYFPQWFYQNTFPVGQFLAYALAETGLSQNIIVKPSIVPSDVLFGFDAKTVNLKDFIDGEKYKDIHDMVDSVVKSMGCQLFSYRGYWWVEGVTRRREETVTALQFDTNGLRIADIVVTKPKIDCGGSLQPTPNFTPQTPWKRVNVNFNAKGTKNLFTESVAKVADNVYHKTSYTTGNYTGTGGGPQPEVYVTNLLNNWNPTLNSDFIYLGMVGRQLLWKVINPGTYAINSYSGYNYTPVMSLANYIECAEKPFVKKGILYEFEVQLKATLLNFNANNEAVKNRLDSGEMDGKIFPFQILLDGIEKFSNRIGFDVVNYYRYKISDASEENRVTLLNVLDGYNHETTFSLKFTFRPDDDALLSFRLLMPNVVNSDGVRVGGETVYGCEVLKLTAVDNVDENTDTITSRDINFTQELDYDIPISCTQDNSILNSFGLGFPLNQDYYKTIPRTDTPYAISGYHFYSPTTALELQLATWKTTDLISKLLFRQGLKANCFLTKVDGQKIPFTALWVFFNNPVSRMGYLTAYDGFPNIPKNYTAYPDVDADDVLQYMQVEYAAEDYAKRLNWKIFGSENVTTYPKALANALHAVRPEMIYRLEAQALKLLWPDNLIEFYFDDTDREFIPTRLNLDLFNGKTSFTATEAKYAELTDITYE